MKSARIVLIPVGLICIIHIFFSMNINVEENHDITWCSFIMHKYGIVPNLHWGNMSARKEERGEWKHRNCDKLVKINVTKRMWCSYMLKHYGVIPRISWGNMTRRPKLREEWKHRDCDNLDDNHNDMTCDDLYGSYFLNDWRNNMKNVCPSNDDFKCKISLRKNALCSFADVMIDLRRIGTTNMGLEREFLEGFMTLNCPRLQNNDPNIDLIRKYLPGLHSHVYKPLQNQEVIGDMYNCDIQIHEGPVFIVSHDFVHNLGHFFQDVMNWWLMTEILRIRSKDTILLNIDGLRPGNILQGRGRWVQNITSPDDFGPFRVILDVLFKRTLGILSDFRPHQKVCLQNVHVYPIPLVDFLWEKFHLVDTCSLGNQASYLYQKFQLAYMSHWRKFGNLSDYKKSVTKRLFLSSQKSNIRIILIHRNVRNLIITSNYIIYILANGKDNLTTFPFPSIRLLPQPTLL